MEVFKIDSYLSDRIRHVSIGILLRNIKPANFVKKVSAIVAFRDMFETGLKMNFDFILSVIYGIQKSLPRERI